MLQYGEFACLSCEKTFAGEIPPLWGDLPACPKCGASAYLLMPLGGVKVAQPVENRYLPPQEK